MTCECRNGGIVRDLGRRRLEHGYRPESLVGVVLVVLSGWWWSGLDPVWACCATMRSLRTLVPICIAATYGRILMSVHCQFTGNCVVSGGVYSCAC